MTKLTVFCVCVGDKYNVGYVYALRDAVKKYLTVPHEFICITTYNKIEGVQTIKPVAPWHTWWSKLNLFHPRISTGPSLYFDLDVVIVGSLDYLVDYTNTFSAPANWAMSGHGGIQSSVMAWQGNWSLPYDSFKYPEDSQRLWGDQEFLTELLGDDWQKLLGVVSYKYHCRGKGMPENAAILSFHGKPDPHEVDDEWILPYTETLHKYIRLNSLS